MKKLLANIFSFISLVFFSSHILSASLELECFGESDLPNLYYGRETLDKSWHLKLEPKLIGFYFSLNEAEKTGKVRFLGLIAPNTNSEEKSFNLSNLEMSERFISAEVKIDIDRKGAFEIDRGKGMIRYWSQSWPKSVAGTCEKLKVLVPKF
tara:strand:- start:298 stop:753 length:456 start_codon:yes stop_codon:yes gene_type:complete